MKLTRKNKEIVGISMLISAVSLLFTFITLACRKRSALTALAMLMAAEGAAGAALLVEEPVRRKRAARRAAKEADEAAIDEVEELFSEDEADEADARIRGVLSDKEEESEGPRSLREIPRDEDATEADFQ
ncbi:MAG: hypothetical protein IJA78_06825 [Clostridia bacterium]|nr:hypothetical protein [Clostridia bacterium]